MNGKTTVIEHRYSAATIALAILVVSFSFSTAPFSPTDLVQLASAQSYQTLSPSVLAQGQDVITAQGAASSLQVRQTNNIVNTQAYYDVKFTTSTTGTIKTIEMIFPPGTYLGAARALEVEGIGEGKPKLISGSTLVYEVNDPVSIPAGTEIRLEFMNINNPPTASNTHTVTVTTRDSSSIIIDGPTVSPVYVMKQIGTDDIANGAITVSKISSSFMTSRILHDGQNGWNPDAPLGLDTFMISDSAVKASNSHVYISVDEPSDVGPLAVNVVCMVEDIINNQFQVVCDLPPADGSVLRYTVINQP
jgi:hypothetical protein